VVCVPERHHSSGNGARAPTRAPAGRARPVPRVSSGAEALRLGRRQETELGCVRLADDDRTGFPKATDERAVVVRHEIAKQLRPEGRADALRQGPEVLDRDRYAGEGTLVPL